MDKLTLDSVFTSGEYKGKTVNDVLEMGKKNIFGQIKKGIMFGDDVLEKAGITRIIRDRKTTCEVVEHVKDNKHYEKETQSLSKILKELETVDNDSPSTDDTPNNDK